MDDMESANEADITHVRVAYVELPPFVEVKDEDGERKLDGFMPAIMKAVTEWMHLNVTWIQQPENQYGTWNGTHFTGMIGMLDREEVDFLVNPIIPNADVLNIADLINPIIYEAFTSLSGKETHEGGIFLYFSVLAPMVWASIGISLIVITFVSALLFLRLSDGTFSVLYSLVEYLWVYVAYMLKQVVSEKWMMRHKKALIAAFMPYLIMSWMIGVAFLIMTVFQSLLVSKLTIIKQYPVVDSLEEFVERTQVTGLAPIEIELQLVLRDSGIPVYDEAWLKLEPELVPAKTVFSDESLQKVQKGKFCIFHGHLILRSVLSEYFQKRGKCNFHLSDNMFFPFPLMVPVRKTLPKKFRDKLNFGITRLVDADLSGKWFKTIYEICHFCTSYSEVNLKPLGLKNIYGVLVIWIVGMATAAVSVIAENIYFKCTKEKKQKRRKNRNHY